MASRHFLKKRFFFFVGFMSWLGISALWPCTLALVSGKATINGRPLMWKNRDATEVNNKMLYFSGTKYKFIGLVNAEDAKGESVWGGLNSEGFAIMNSLAEDLGTQGKGGADNGRLMKQALGECARLADFENLLGRIKGTMNLSADFGVIDAEGNACFFETSRSFYEKFDARDARVAPFGYIVRTNYAFTSPDLLLGSGFIRFERISHVIQAARGQNGIDLKFILQEASRDLVHEKLHSYPLTVELPSDPASPLFINTSDTINRYSSVSAVVFQGAPSIEKAFLATMWVLLGQPVSTVAVPLWVGAGKVPAATTGLKAAPLNTLSKALVSYLYPDQRSRMKQYLNINRLRTYGGEGVLGRLFKIENQMLEQTASKLSDWEKKKPAEAEMADFQEKIASWAYESMRLAFPDIKIEN
jgi:hypothetical protein